MTKSYRFESSFAVKKQRRLNPVWHGIGFVVMVALTIGTFWLAGLMLELNWQQPFLPFPVPRNFTLTLHEALPVIPGRLMVQVVTTLLIDLLAFALMVLVYGIVNPIRPGPTDVRQPRGSGRSSRVR
jgi:hypothetical protein